MRRILRKIAANEADKLGDISTLAEPSVVENLKASYEVVRLAKKYEYADHNNILRTVCLVNLNLKVCIDFFPR